MAPLWMVGSTNLVTSTPATSPVFVSLVLHGNVLTILYPLNFNPVVLVAKDERDHINDHK